MYKAITCTLIAILMLATFDFDKENRPTPYELENPTVSGYSDDAALEQTVYTFEGQCDQFTITDGKITMNPTLESEAEEIIQYGELTVTDPSLDYVIAYTTHFYLMLGDTEQHTIQANTVENTMGVPSGSLGEDALANTILGDKTMPGNALIGNLYMDLTVTYQDGQVHTITVPLTVTNAQ